jgi:hypothetical protein
MFKQKTCDFEPRVVESVKTGALRETLSEHLETCAACRETARIAAFLQADLKTGDANLPSAGFVFWKSKIVERRRRSERVAQPIFIAQLAAGFVFLATALWLLFSKSAPSAAIDTLAAVQSLILPLFAVVAGFTFLFILFFLILRRYFSEK